MQCYGRREESSASFNKYRTFPGWNSNPHSRYHGQVSDPPSWTGPGPRPVRDSINWTHRALSSNYNTGNRPSPDYGGQEMERQHGGIENHRQRGDLVQEWQPKPYRGELGVGSKSYRDLEAWASRYYHSLPRKNQNIEDVSGSGHEAFKSKPPPPYIPVKPSLEASPERRFSHPPNYTPPPPYSSSQNPKKPNGAPARAVMEPRFGRTPDHHGGGTFKLNQAEYGCHTSSAPTKQSKPRRRAGGTVFCLVSRLDVPNPSEEALKNVKRGQIQEVQPEDQAGGSLESRDNVHQEPRKDALEKIRSERRPKKEDGSNDASKLSTRRVKHQEQTTRLPLWKEPKSKGLEKTNEPNQDQSERVSNPNHNRGLVVIDATCVVVKVELLVRSEKELVQYVYKVQNNNKNAEGSTDAFFSKCEKASQTLSLRNGNWDPQSSQRENNIGLKTPEDQSKGTHETKESERERNEEETTPENSPIPKFKQKDQSSVLKAVRQFESRGITVKKFNKQRLKLEGEEKERPSDKPEMKNLNFCPNAGPITKTKTIQCVDPVPSGICLENVGRFCQECHRREEDLAVQEGRDSGDDLRAETDDIEDPNPTRPDQTYGEDVNHCPSTLGQQDRSSDDKSSSPSHVTQDHVKIMTDLFAQEGQNEEEEDLYPNTDLQNPHLVLEKESEMFEQKGRLLIQTNKDLVPNLESSSESFGPESADSTHDITPSFFGDHLGSRSFQETNVDDPLFKADLQTKGQNEDKEDLHPNTDIQSPRLVLEKESKMFEQIGRLLCPPLLGDQKNKNLNPNLESSSESFGPESSSSTHDITPHFFGDHLERSFQETIKEEDLQTLNPILELLGEVSYDIPLPPSFFGDHLGSESGHEISLRDEPDGPNLNPTLEHSSNTRDVPSKVSPPFLGEALVEEARHTQVDVRNKTDNLQTLSSDLESMFGEEREESPHMVCPAFFGDDVESKSGPEGGLNETKVHDDVENLRQTLLQSKKVVQDIPESFHQGNSDANHDVNNFYQSFHGNKMVRTNDDETGDGNQVYPNVLVRNMKDISESLGREGPSEVTPPGEVPYGRASLSDEIQNLNPSRSSTSSSPSSSSPSTPLWDAVSRIRRHTAPDSEREEDEHSERWAGPDDEDEKMEAEDDGKCSAGDAEEHPEESDGTESSCSLDSHDSSSTVIQGVNLKESDEEEGSSPNHGH